MAVVRLRGPLQKLAGGRAEHDLDGATVVELLRALERAQPAVGGWILDERGLIRRHVNVFVNGERGREATAVGPGDRVEVLPAISGGDRVTELIVGTKKGLFVLEGEPGGEFDVTARAFAGEPVEHALRDPRSGRLLAAVTSAFYGPKVFLADDPDGDWEQARGVALPAGGDRALERIWVIAPGERDGTLYAGGDPGVLFESRDGGESWELNAALWEHPTRDRWQPGGGGLCVHSIVSWPGEPERLAVGISAAGVWLTDDGGRTWERGNDGLVPRYVPEEAREEEVGLCVHRLERAPRRPERLFMQFHGGVYRSDDAGRTWIDVGTGTGLPSDFGFPLAVDPADADSAYVVPLTADIDRVTPGGRVRVYETRDAGASWAPRGDGLPAGDAYLTVLRRAFDARGEGDALELYFGATSGEVFSSGDAGATWGTAALRLPPVYSIAAGR
jgi:molybdopterin converting factor small subunit/photosystem II stability/assembly factor-like uncharacterized protein